jgi:hypothetical protein
MCGQFGLVLGDPPMVELVGQGPVPHHDAAAGRQFPGMSARNTRYRVVMSLTIVYPATCPSASSGLTR